MNARNARAKVLAELKVNGIDVSDSVKPGAITVLHGPKTLTATIGSVRIKIEVAEMRSTGDDWLEQVTRLIQAGDDTPDVDPNEAKLSGTRVCKICGLEKVVVGNYGTWLNDDGVRQVASRCNACKAKDTAAKRKKDQRRP